MNKGKIVLFQGDSVTDCERDRKDTNSLGEGYAAMVASVVNTMMPEWNITFKNRGVSGNRIRDLLARYDKDILKVKPDIISILIGVNDTWRRYDSNDPTSAEEFEKDYKTLLSKIKKDLPKCKIMLMEPFVLPSLPDRTKWREDLDPKIQVVRRLAGKYAKAYLPLDGIFAQAGIDQYDCREMAEDGVHPTPIGHRIIAKGYIKELTKLIAT